MYDTARPGDLLIWTPATNCTGAAATLPPPSPPGISRADILARFNVGADNQGASPTLAIGFLLAWTVSCRVGAFFFLLRKLKSVLLSLSAATSPRGEDEHSRGSGAASPRARRQRSRVEPSPRQGASLLSDDGAKAAASAAAAEEPAMLQSMQLEVEVLSKV